MQIGPQNQIIPLESPRELGNLTSLSYQNLCTDLGLSAPESSEDGTFNPLEVILKSNFGFMKNAEALLLSYAESLGRKMAKAVTHNPLYSQESGVFIVEIQTNQSYAGKVISTERGKKLFSLSPRTNSSQASADGKRESGPIDFFPHESKDFTIVEMEQFETLYNENDITVGTLNPDFLCNQGITIFGSHLDSLAVQQIQLISLSNNQPLEVKVERLMTGMTGAIRIRATEKSFLETLRKQDISGKQLYCFSLQLSKSPEACFHVELSPSCILVEEGSFWSEMHVDAQMSDDNKLIIPLPEGFLRGRIDLRSHSPATGETTLWEHVEDVTFKQRKDKVFEYDAAQQCLRFPLSSDLLRDVHSHRFYLNNSVISKIQTDFYSIDSSLIVSGGAERKTILAFEDFRIKSLKVRFHANSSLVSKNEEGLYNPVDSNLGHLSAIQGNLRPLITLNDYQSFCLNTFRKVRSVFSRVSEVNQRVQLCLLGSQSPESRRLNDFDSVDELEIGCRDLLLKRVPAGIMVDFVKPVFRDIRVVFRVELSSTSGSERVDFTGQWSSFFKPLGFEKKNSSTFSNGYCFGDTLTLESFRSFLGSLKSVQGVRNVEWVDAKTLKKVSQITTKPFEIIRIDPKVDLVLSSL